LWLFDEQAVRRSDMLHQLGAPAAELVIIVGSSGEHCVDDLSHPAAALALAGPVACSTPRAGML
jgi:hypothetical protein